MFEGVFGASHEAEKFSNSMNRNHNNVKCQHYSCFYFVTACPSGFFGLNCSRECHCQNGGVCDATDGHCTCAAGWMGTFCQQRKCIFLKKKEAEALSLLLQLCVLIQRLF